MLSDSQAEDALYDSEPMRRPGGQPARYRWISAKASTEETMSLVLIAIMIAVPLTYWITRHRYKTRYRDRYQKADLQRLNAVYQPPPDRKLHVYTVATRPDPALDALIDSCHRKGLGLHVLGINNLWQGFGNKYLWTAEYLDLQRLSGDDVMVFVDAYDVLALADEREILEKFRESAARIIFTAEKTCYPDPSLAVRYPRSPTSFKYLNSGGAIGYVSDVRAMIEMIGFQTTDDDQRAITRFFLDHPGRIALDTQCTFFLPLFAVGDAELDLDLNEGRVVLRETGRRPCFLHGNGPSVTYLHDLGQRLGVTGTRDTTP